MDRLETRITIKDFIASGFSAEIEVYGPDGAVRVKYYAAKIEIEEKVAPESLRDVVDAILEVVGQS